MIAIHCNGTMRCTCGATGCPDVCPTNSAYSASNGYVKWVSVDTEESIEKLKKSYSKFIEKPLALSAVSVYHKHIQKPRSLRKSMRLRLT